MNKNKQNQLLPTFAPETHFELRPAPLATFRVTQDSEFERLKKQLLARELAEAAPELNAPLRRAANEAAAIAWSTLFPLLVFPALFEEKIEATLRQVERQMRILTNSRELLAA